MIKARVFKIESKDYYVITEDDKRIRCYLPKKFKKAKWLKRDKQYILDIVCVGDIVEIELNEDGTGSIKKIEERKNYLSRKAPRIKGASFRGERLEQLIVSNIDNLIVICSVEKPVFNNRLLDRIITSGESSNIRIVIVINKIDLDKERVSNYWRDIYENIGYKVILTSKLNIDSMDALKQELKNHISLFCGQSGVGKSTILNLIDPSLNLKVGEISEATGKGTHTTVTALMEKINDDTYLVDTPGIREFDPYGISRENLGHYFIEFGQYLRDCKFNTCTHHHEPGCAVIEAVSAGKISEERYQSYLNLLDSVEDDMFI
jgi:ribosome biogenesis GTPase